MKFLHSLNVGRRLAVAFALLIVLLAGSTSLALYEFKTVKNQVSIIIEINNRKAQLLNQMRESNMLGERYIRDFMLASPQQQPAIDAQLKANRAHYAELWAALKRLPTTADGMRARQTIEDSLTAARATNNRLLGMIRSGDLDGAKQLLRGEAQPLLERRSKAIGAAVELQNAQNAAGAAAILGSVALANRALIAFGLLSAGLAAALAWLISRSLVRPLTQATQVADAIAHGKLDNPIGPQPGDEPGQLLTSMRGMQDQLKAVAAAQQDMARRHDDGQISFRMDEAVFPGEYGSMVRDTNALVDSHIAVKMKLAQIMSRYAIGDLSQDMDRLPGEKAVLCDTMDAVKRNLFAMNSEIKCSKPCSRHRKTSGRWRATAGCCGSAANTCRSCRSPITTASAGSSPRRNHWWWWSKAMARRSRWKWTNCSASNRWWSRTSRTTTAASRACPAPPSWAMDGSR